MPTTPQPIDLARSHLAAGRLAEAEAACRDLLRDDEACVPALHLQALATAQTGRLAEGAALLERAVQLAPDAVAARNDLGAMLITLARPLEAEAQLRAAVALQPDNVEAQVNLGNALHAQGRLEAAEAVYRAALRREPRHVRGLLSLGNLLCPDAPPGGGTAVPRGARRPWRRASPPPTSSSATRCGTWAGTTRPSASYRRALAIEPGNADANESLGILLKAQGRYAEALGCFRASGNPYRPGPGARVRAAAGPARGLLRLAGDRTRPRRPPTCTRRR